MSELAVVVPVRDGAAVLPRLLGALRGQTLDSSQFEVVVVDNASRDASAEVARREGARVVSEPQPGRARARNAGVAACNFAAVAFIDAECVPEPGWLEALTACLRETPLVAGAVRLETGEPPNAVERFEASWRFHQERNVRDAGWAASANLAITRDAFEAIGGFDTGYRQIGEDVDLCLRARSAGLALAFCEGAVVSHPAERRLSDVLRRGARHGYSSTQHHYRLPGPVGRRYWRHPGPLVRGDWALRRFSVDPAALAASERRRQMSIARIEYGARVAGSLWAELSGAR